MSAARIAVIGHTVAMANEFVLPDDSRQVSKLLQLHNFTRIVTDDGKLTDHIAYLKQDRQVPDDETFSIWEMYLCAGLLLGSHLERNGFEVKLINYIDSANEQAVLGDLQEFAPDIVVLSTTFVLTKAHLLKVGRRLREALPDAFIVAGGHHVLTTLMYMTPDEQAKYLTDAHLDAFIQDSQGEKALLALCKTFPGDLSGVSNMVWRRADGTVEHNPRVLEDNDINDTLIEIDDSFAGSMVHIRTARSCAFKCAFCSYPMIAGDLSLMEIDNVMATLWKAKRSGVKTVFFVDDTFNVPRPRFEALMDRMIEEGLEIPWYSFFRCQYSDEALIKKMRQTGCTGVFLGVESGSDQILKNMKKGAIVRFYRDGVRWLREQGIVTVGSFIIGFPGETDETVEQTRAFIEESGLDYYFIQPFYYLHHTPIHKRAEDFGLTGEGLFWSHNTMNWSQAVAHINRLFLDIEAATFVNPDYTLWEIAYLHGKGMSSEEILDYRRMINRMTAKQMETYGITAGDVTSRVA
jgi:hypothetical protein